LESLQKQTLVNWECIIVDDGSSDNTKVIVSKFTSKDQRYSYIYQKNAGLSAARNTGIKAAKGEFIQLLDADDFISENKLNEQVKVLRKNNNVSLLYGELRYFNTNNPTELYYTLNGGTESWMKSYPSHEEFTEHLIRNNLFAVNCVIFRKSIIKDCGYFNTKLKSVEDWEFWVRCALLKKHFLFDGRLDSIALVRIHETSMSQNNRRMLESSIDARIFLQKHISFSKLSNRTKLKKINEIELNFLHRKIYELYSNHNKIKKMKHLFRGYSLIKNYKFLLKEIINSF
jgi:glycosyltransferase involved in cell wall biosynthesis